MQHEAPNPGACFKQTVTATVITESGDRYVATNACTKPQDFCARQIAGIPSGTGYELCAKVCGALGHAEERAIQLAPYMERHGAKCYVEGHTFACDSCKCIAETWGVEIIVGAPPPEKYISPPHVRQCTEAERELYEKLAEECLEAAHRVLKLVKFGIDEVQPGQDQNNMERLESELGDVLAAMEVLQERDLLDGTRIGARIPVAAERLRKYQQKAGRKTPSQIAALLCDTVRNAAHDPALILPKESKEADDLPHLLWMCQRILEGFIVGDKAWTWIGYIQGVLVRMKVATLDDMKEMNRA